MRRQAWDRDPQVAYDFVFEIESDSFSLAEKKLTHYNSEKIYSCVGRRWPSG